LIYTNILDRIEKIGQRTRALYRQKLDIAFKTMIYVQTSSMERFYSKFEEKIILSSWGLFVGDIYAK